MHVEKGTIYKESFWTPKYTADVFDGKTLWLLIDEELGRKYYCGKEQAYGQKGNYGPDFDESIRLAEDYKNIRDLRYVKQTFPSSYLSCFRFACLLVH
jgi:hypothetical protein